MKAKPRLLVNGKPYERPICERVKRLMAICDKIPYRQAILSVDLASRMGLTAGSSPDKFLGTPRELAEVQARKFKLDAKTVFWGNPRTIADLKNGKIIP